MAMTASRKAKLSQLRKIAWRSWNPIGLHPEDPAGNDEYDSYLLQVMTMIGQERPRDEAIDYLIAIESEHMGLGLADSTRDRAETTVDAIRAYTGRLRAPVRRIELDAAGWRVEADLWNALLSSLGAPAWHGHNYDALWETITEVADYGRAEDQAINSVQPPFEIIVIDTGSLTPLLAQRLEDISKLLEEAKAEYDLDVGLRT
jgi:RNAse (barnase) inhibitor barstar